MLPKDILPESKWQKAVLRKISPLPKYLRTLNKNP